MFFDDCKQFFRIGQVAGVRATVEPENFPAHRDERGARQLADIAVFPEGSAQAHARSCFFGFSPPAFQVRRGKDDLTQRCSAEAHCAIGFFFRVGDAAVRQSVRAAEFRGAFGVRLNDADDTYTSLVKGRQPLAQLRE